MSFWKKAAWVAAGVGAVVAAPVTGGGSIAALVGAAGTTTAAGIALGAAGGLAASSLTEESKKEAENRGRREGRAQSSVELDKLSKAFEQQAKHFSSHQEYFDYIIALQTVGLACAVCDGRITASERAEIDEFIAGVASSKLPASIKKKISKVAKTRPTIDTAFELATPFMKTKEQRQDFEALIESTMLADGRVHPKEEAFMKTWKQMAA